jgi:hypothetical protein
MRSHRTAELSNRLADAERVVGATDRLVLSMTETNADLRWRLGEAVEALAEARREGSLAESKWAVAEARLGLLQATHNTELPPVRETGRVEG